jgi:crotonobetaine/carnitine-CoA ligase
VAIAIVLQPGHRFEPSSLIAHCEQRMARFAVPRYVRVLDELPRTPSQRLQKYKLREAGVTADMWDATVRS